MKCSFFQAAVVSILLHGCTARTLTKRMEKRLDSNYTRMLRTILNRSWRQHPKTSCHQPLITNTIKIRQTRQAGHCWRSRDVFVSDVLPWTPSYERAKATFRIGYILYIDFRWSSWPAKIYIQQLCADTGCSPENLPEAIDDRKGWWERVRDIWTDSATWGWWWCLASYLLLDHLLLTQNAIKWSVLIP